MFGHCSSQNILFFFGFCFLFFSPPLPTKSQQVGDKLKIQTLISFVSRSFNVSSVYTYDKGGKEEEQDIRMKKGKKKGERREKRKKKKNRKLRQSGQTEVKPTAWEYEGVRSNPLLKR